MLATLSHETLLVHPDWMRSRSGLAPACPPRRIGAIANPDRLHRIANEIADHARTPACGSFMSTAM